MKIKKVNGTKFDGDTLYLVETKGEEPITMYSLFLLINQLALNEAKRYKNFLPSLLFEDFMVDAIKYGKEGFDFLDDSSDWLLKKILEKSYPKSYKKMFKKYTDTRIKEFGVEE